MLHTAYLCNFTLMTTSRKDRPVLESSPSAFGVAQPELLTVREVSSILRMHPQRVYKMPIPRILLSRGRVRWHRADILAFIESRRGTVEPGGAT